MSNIFLKEELAFVQRNLPLNYRMGGYTVRGHVRKKKGKDGKNIWYAVIEFERDAETHKRVQKWYNPRKELGLSRPATKAQAQVFLENKLYELNNPPQPQKTLPTQNPDMTFEKWIEAWLAGKKNVLRQTTFDQYETLLKQHVIPEIGDIKISELSREDIQQLIDSKQQSGRKDGKPGGLSPKTLKHIRVLAKAILGEAFTDGLIDSNPMAKVTSPRVPDSGVRAWSAEEARKFLKSVGEHRLFCLFWLLLHTGLRRGEVLGLKWEDVDLQNNIISIRQQYVATSEGNAFHETKTKTGKRSIALSVSTIHKLKKHRERQSYELDVIGKNKDMGLVFTGENGGPIDPRWFSRLLASEAEKAGVPTLTPHELRHTAATLMLRLGVHPKIVQERLGHANIATTLDLYSHVTPGL
ncbi:MAG: site-specific integrase, partial [Dethiobacter sp.]|nr:site-specific integrase [Dethiobacter sp.]